MSFVPPSELPGLGRRSLLAGSRTSSDAASTSIVSSRLAGARKRQQTKKCGRTDCKPSSARSQLRFVTHMPSLSPRRAPLTPMPEQTPAQLEVAVSELASMFPDADLDFLRSLLKTQEPPILENAANQLLGAKDYPKKRSEPSAPRGPPQPQQLAAHGQQQAPMPPNGGGLLSNLRRQFGKGERPQAQLPPPPALTTAAEGASRQRVQSHQPAQGHTPGATPTSVDAIRANLTRAIQVR